VVRRRVWQAGTEPVLVMLSNSIMTEMVTPLLQSTGRAECLRLVGKNWHSFCETLNALHVLIARASSEERAIEVANEASNSAAIRVLDAARSIGGEDAEDEAHFAISTYRGAVEIVGSFSLTDPPSDKANDAVFSQAFGRGAALYCLGAVTIFAASEAGNTHSKVARDVAFELLRAGALGAYSAAREGYDLRFADDYTMEEPSDISEFHHQLAEADLALPRH
jgi:hypothetical protein